MKVRMRIVPSDTKNVAYSRIRIRWVSFRPSTLTTPNSGSVTTMGGNRRTTIRKVALRCNNGVRMREYANPAVVLATTTRMVAPAVTTRLLKSPRKKFCHLAHRAA